METTWKGLLFRWFCAIGNEIGVHKRGGMRKSEGIFGPSRGCLTVHCSDLYVLGCNVRPVGIEVFWNFWNHNRSVLFIVFPPHQSSKPVYFGALVR